MKREIFKRLGFGALCGAAGTAPLIILFPYMEASRLAELCDSSVRLAEYVRLGAGCLWGAAVCAGAALWKRESGTFFTHSLWNYLLDCAAFVLWAWCCLGFVPYWPTVAVLWGIFTALYAVGWVVRWLTCRDDVEAIRRKLGLGPSAPSPLNWRECLPHLLLTAILFLFLQPLASLMEPPDVPIFAGLVLPLLAWPFIAAVVGFGAALRYGFCPLLPPVTALAFLPNLLWSAYDWRQAVIYGGLSLLGELAGLFWRRVRRKGDAE